MQAPKRTQKLPMSEKEVRQAKGLLLEGHTIVSVAMFMERSTECISRLKRGLSHKNVVVPGEARLRQPNPILGERDGEEGPRELTEVEKAEQEAVLAKLMRVQKELDGETVGGGEEGTWEAEKARARAEAEGDV